MKHFIFPVIILTALFSFSLLNSHAMRQNVDIWASEMEQAQVLSSQENWDDTVHTVESAYKQWLSCQTYLHIVCAHGELNNAESLFRRCLILSRDEDAPEFHTNAAELIAQLHHLSEAESVSIKNVF